MLPMKCLGIGLFCVALLGFTTEARAAVRLEYSREGRCPDEQAFRDVVAARMGFDPFEQGASARLVVTLAFRPPRSYEGRAELHDGRAVQWVEPIPAVPDCTSAVRALGLAVAVRLRESHDDPPPPSTPTAPVQAPMDEPKLFAGSEAPERTSTPMLAVKSSEAPSVGQEADRRVRVALDGGLSIATVPGEVAGEVAASAGYMLHPFSFWAEFRFTIPRETDYASAFRLLGGLVPCVHWRIGRSPEFFTCVVAQAGALWAHGVRPLVVTSRSTVLPYLGFGPRFGLELSIIASRLAWRGGGDLMFTAVRPQLTVNDRTPIWTASIVSGVVEAGLVLSF
jgi:hypothetical protein